MLVVCHANVARSVAAALLLRDAVDERRVALDLRTAGTHASDGQPASGRTVAALRRLTGADPGLGSHLARELRATDVEWADLIIAMEDSQVRFVRRRHPEAADRVATLALLADELPVDGRALHDRVVALGLAGRDGSGEGDVEDPAGGDDDAYDRAVAVLVERCSELSRRLAG